MRQEVITFKIVCDCCGETFEDDNGFVCFTNDVDGNEIMNEALSADWLEFGNRHYCPKCYEYDDNGNVVTKDRHKYDGETGEELKK